MTMLKQLAIVLAATALMACSEEAQVATTEAVVEAVPVEVVATEAAVSEAVVSETTEAVVETSKTTEESPVKESVATGSVEG
jgi:uncharacterized protein YcfL